MSRLYLLEISKILIYYYFMIGKDSTKLIFTLPKTLYSQLKQEAEEQNRSSFHWQSATERKKRRTGSIQGLADQYGKCEDGSK